MIAPNTEADLAAVLSQFLTAFGALVGRGPHFRVEGDEHHVNLYALLVGATAKGRKGTSWGRVHEVFERIPDWTAHVSGLSSGEGLKYHVREAREETKTNKHGELVTEIMDEGVKDKRLLVVESEFASVLRAGQRQGNTLSATIREGWDPKRSFAMAFKCMSPRQLLRRTGEETGGPGSTQQDCEHQHMSA